MHPGSRSGGLEQHWMLGVLSTGPRYNCSCVTRVKQEYPSQAGRVWRGEVKIQEGISGDVGINSRKAQQDA